MLVFIILIVTFTYFLIYSRRQKATRKLPPGPGGLPLIGNLIDFGTQGHLKLFEWAEQYGKFFTFHLGHVPVLVLNDKTNMKDLLGRMEATGRYQAEVMTMTTWHGSYGLLTAEGKAWVEQKLFCLKALRQFGFGRLSQMEPMILREVDDFCTIIEKEQASNQSIILNGTLNVAVGNVLLNMLAGEDSQLDRSQFAHLTNEWVSSIQLTTQTGLVFFPWLKYFAPVQSGYTNHVNICKQLQSLVEACFEEHKISRISGEPARDMIDAYFDQMEACKDPESTFYGEEGMIHSFGSVATLMIAASGGTGSSLHWLIFYLSAHQNSQRKLQAEIDEVIGKNRNPSFSDKSAMPYMEAVVLETLRFSSQTTIGGTVSLLEDVNWEGYQLPKGMMIMSNLYRVHYDKAIWGDPENFRPERFLEQEGDKLKEFVVAFHPGKRACPGEWFAKYVLFLFVTKLFQKYSFSVPAAADPKEYLKPMPGFLLYPHRLPVVVTARAVEL